MFQKNVGCRNTLSLRYSYILTLIFTFFWGSCDVTLVYQCTANYLPTCHCCKWSLEAHDVLKIHTFQLNSPLEIRLPWPILCNAHIICSYSHNPITFIENLPFQNIPCIWFRLLVLHYLIFNFLHKVKTASLQCKSHMKSSCTASHNRLCPFSYFTLVCIWGLLRGHPNACWRIGIFSMFLLCNLSYWGSLQWMKYNTQPLPNDGTEPISNLLEKPKFQHHVF